ncbi:AraC family transcriptional activator of pobA [Shimia isoporae]|uniref:AraC family transcriptional activator of pobA n=2 Tax=Shimia isoporae TaxID=647720 RepID=A0A4R1NLK7_9RHOB|nr:AraC family transcriptional activator of pobA [Shimia isoporae]
MPAGFLELHPAPHQSLPRPLVHTIAQHTAGAPWMLELLHVRTHHLLIWTTRGQGRVLLNGVRRGFGTHNAIFAPAGKLVSIELGLQVQGQIALIPADDRFSFPDRAQHLRLQDGTEQLEFIAILEALRRELHEDRPFIEEALNAHTQLLSVTLRRDLLAAGDPPAAKAAQKLARAYGDLLSRHFTEGHSMAWFADKLDVTPTHLSRVCKQSAGMTAADMLSQLIQHRARLLLIATDRPMRIIAQDLGFGSAAYFTRFCQQHFGAPPSQIRKQARPAKRST